MKCLECGSKMTVSKESLFHYKASGLSKVFLRGVTVEKCSNEECGEEEVSIPNIEELHNLLSDIVAKQETKLAPEEIRFLRTHLGFSGVDIARRMSVTPETVSRWENGKMEMGEVAERLLRLMVLASKGPITDYELFDHMASKAVGVKKKIIEMEHKHWREKVA